MSEIVKKTSSRELLQNEIVNWLEERSERFDAPYGIISSIENVRNGKGKVRTVTFGICAYLDATLFIYSNNDIRIKAEGPFASKFEKQKYSDKDELLKELSVI